MTLEEKLAVMREESAKKFPPETMVKFQQSKDDLKSSGVLESVLNIGETMPSFSLQNVRGEFVSSAELLKKGNLVITFYRGIW